MTQHAAAILVVLAFALGVFVGQLRRSTTAVRLLGWCLGSLAILVYVMFDRQTCDYFGYPGIEMSDPAPAAVALRAVFAILGWSLGMVFGALVSD